MRGAFVAGAATREQFLAALFNGPLLTADAIVVLSGDGLARLAVALGALRQRAAHWVAVSGGLDNPPHSLTAEAMAEHLVENGLDPERIIKEGASQNTYDQAEWLAAEIREREWGAVLLATSAYHMPRAFLTVVASLERAEVENCRVTPLTASQAKWWGTPDGLCVTRAELFDGELEKIEAYRALGHVASYEDGLAYLRKWEGHDAG